MDCHATATQRLAMTASNTASEKVDSKETAQNVDKSPNEKAEIVPDKISAGGRIFDEKAGLCSLLRGDKTECLSHKQKASPPLFRKKPTPKPNKTQTPKMKNTLNTKLLLEGFRDNNAILALKCELHEIAKDLQESL